MVDSAAEVRETEEMGNRGRPPLDNPAAVKKSGIFVALSPDEKEAYYEWYKEDGAKSPGAWLRKLAESRIKQLKKKREREKAKAKAKTKR